MKKIAFLIFASAFFFFSCKTTNSSAENADAQNLLDANEISQADEGVSELDSELESEQNENQAQDLNEIPSERNAAEKNEREENAQENEKIEESEIGSAQENSSDEASQENAPSSNEILSQENSIENGESSAQEENARSEEISSEEKNPPSAPYDESVSQVGQDSSEEISGSENAIAENNGAEADVSTARDSNSSELGSAQGDSNSQAQSASQTENERRPQTAPAQNPATENSARENQNSGQRQNVAPRQNQRQNAPSNSAQNDLPRDASPSERNAVRPNSSNGNSTRTSPTENSARQNSRNENSSAVSGGGEIASSYDFSGDDENSAEGETEEKSETPVPSRSLTLKRNQFVDIIYPGNGWIYLGEEGGDHFTFYGRKQKGGESVFTLRSKKAGKALLHFYKNDALTGKYIDDYIELNVTQESALDASHVEAPSYAQAVPQKYERKNQDEEADAIPLQGETGTTNSENKIPHDEKKSSETIPNNSDRNSSAKNVGEENARNAAQDSAASEKVQTVVQTSRTQEESSPRTSIASAQNPPARNENLGKNSQASSNAASLLEQAQKAYDEKRYADALGLVRKFLEVTTENIDAGIFLEGQILEAKSEVRDIKSAIVDYDTVVKDWPQSKFWKRANERAIYLKRFYINIR